MAKPNKDLCWRIYTTYNAYIHLSLTPKKIIIVILKYTLLQTLRVNLHSATTTPIIIIIIKMLFPSPPKTLAAATLLSFASHTSATLLWDGRLNNYTSASFLSNWSWSNPIGPYQYYIHGSGSVSDYISLSPSYKNPHNTNSLRGIQLSIDNTSSWNGQYMMRTELIPFSTTAQINESKVFYHFSLSHTNVNPPSITEEHQICFFESHFMELKYGPIASSSSSNNTTNTTTPAPKTSSLLHFLTSSTTSHWNTTLLPGIWHNIAYGIDFNSRTVSFYHSIGGEDLKLIVDAIPAETYSDGKDWHLGVLRLPEGGGPEGKRSGVREDWRFSGVWIEEGEITTRIGGGVGGSSSGAGNSSCVE